MNRNEFLRHLTKHGCHISHEGGNHSIVQNIKTGKSAPMPRHQFIQRGLALKICKQLEIEKPTSF
jgi:hypothetical protein